MITHKRLKKLRNAHTFMKAYYVLHIRASAQTHKHTPKIPPHTSQSAAALQIFEAWTIGQFASLKSIESPKDFIGEYRLSPTHERKHITKVWDFLICVVLQVWGELIAPDAQTTVWSFCKGAIFCCWPFGRATDWFLKKCVTVLLLKCYSFSQHSNKD